jgi:hypothetical protein
MRKLLVTSLILLLTGFSYAQETKPDTLKTEEIIVVKPYTPTISDAFKVKSNPVIEDANEIQREKVNYSIFSIPVASTFAPSKGKAKGVVKEPKERLFDNYISAGFGNFTSPLFEAYIHTGDAKYNDFGIFANHHSSEGGIKDLLLNDDYSDTRIDIYYKQYDRDLNWQLNAGLHRNQYNYYGLPSEEIFNQEVIDAMDEEQVYKSFYAGGKISVADSFFQGASAELVNFSDNYDSNELQLLIKPTLEFPISSELINSEFSIDVLSGKFKQNYFTEEDVKHSFLNLGFNPNFEVRRENLTVNLGAKLYYSNDLDNKTSSFYAYPNVFASLKVVDDVFILVAGATGDLIQNTYRDFSKENPFVSPTLDIQITDKQYKAFIGAKGKLASNVSYNFNLSHSNEKNKPLFIQNETMTDGTFIVSNAFQAGNSFNVIYDDIKSLSFFGELNIEASKEFNFGGSIDYSSFTTTDQTDAWNLPTIKATVTADYQNQHWFAGGKLFFNGQTKDLIKPFSASSASPVIIKNKSYVDLNFHGGYIFSDRLTAFGRINNALGKKYHTFVNYQVQSLQVLAGITYKFDL